MPDIYVGIDPGQKGAIVALGRDLAIVQAIEGADLYTGRDLLDSAAVNALNAIREHGRIKLAVVERQWVRPGQGAVSQSRIVGDYRAWRAILSVMGIPFLDPAPSRWQAVLAGTGGQGKERAIRLCAQRLPWLDLMPGRKRTPQDGLADAACMALWGMGQ